MSYVDSYCKGYDLGHKHGKRKARWEMVAVVVFLYFIIAAIGHFFG